MLLLKVDILSDGKTYRSGTPCRLATRLEKSKAFPNIGPTVVGDVFIVIDEKVILTRFEKLLEKNETIKTKKSSMTV